MEGYILDQTLTGIQALKDSIGARGVKEYTEKVNSPQREIKKLKGKTNVLKRTVDETILTISDMEKAISTTIKQLADSISISVDENGNIKTSLELEKNGMSFKGNKVVFGFDNFKIDEDGNVEVSGKYSNKSATGAKAIEINKNKINFYSWANDDHLSGVISSTYQPATNSEAIMLACNQGDLLGFGYTPDGGNSFHNLMYFDTSDLSKVPNIRNTTSGNIFSGVNGGGITVDNGLITKWNMPGTYGTISVISGLAWNSNGITEVYRTDIEVKSGLIVSWDKYQSYP